MDDKLTLVLTINQKIELYALYFNFMCIFDIICSSAAIYFIK